MPYNIFSILILNSFLEDIPFCQYLFNTPDNYQIRISTTDFILIGYISTL